MIANVLRRVTAVAGSVLKMAGNALENEDKDEDVKDKAKMDAPASEPKPHKAFVAQVDASIAGMKDTAKWTVGVFAALAAILVAGTQLSSLGKLEGPSWMEDHRLLFALVAFLVALVAIGVIIWKVLGVLAARPKSLDEVTREEAAAPLDNPTRDVAFIKASNLLEPGETVQTFNEKSGTLMQAAMDAKASGDVTSITASYSDIERHNARIEMFQAVLRFHAVRQAMARSKGMMLVAGVVGGFAIGVFTWAANPPAAESSPDPFQLPAAATMRLSEDNQKRWTDELGAECVAGPISVVVLGVNDDVARVVTTPGGDCALRQLDVSMNEMEPAERIEIPATPVATTG